MEIIIYDYIILYMFLLVLEGFQPREHISMHLRKLKTLKLWKINKSCYQKLRSIRVSPVPVKW